jgi:D-alanyl-D-alanine carboxypeptidase (penicillin-binding protein 5/6)
MKKILNALRRLVAVPLCLAAFAATAQAPQPPEIAARAYLLLDVTANQILAAKDIDSPVEPASLTKLMTAYLVFDALRAKKLSLTQTLSVSERAWKMPGSRMFIDPKMQVPVEDLIKGMIVQSGNDATVALAEGVGGTVERFVEMMNAQAQALGMKNSTFKNPEGLTATGHVTTARDLATLATRLMKDFPSDVAYYAIHKYRYPGTPASNDTNRNLLLFRDPTVDGLKTGHTNAAGYCLVATARRDRPARSHRRGGARRQRSPGQDPGAAARSPGGAVHQGPGCWHAEGHPGRPAVGRRAAGRAGRRRAGRRAGPRLGCGAAVDQVTREVGGH